MPFTPQNKIVTMLKKQVFLQTLEAEEKNYEIVAVFNRYKDILETKKTF